jgi:hypothetical protein
MSRPGDKGDLPAFGQPVLWVEPPPGEGGEHAAQAQHSPIRQCDGRTIQTTNVTHQIGRVHGSHDADS